MSGAIVRRVLGAAILAGTGIASARPAAPTGRPHQVEIRGAAFHPESLAVAPGDTVVWVNRDLVPHTVSAPDAGWDSGEVPPGERFTWVASDRTVIRYVCRYHPGMIGALRVR